MRLLLCVCVGGGRIPPTSLTSKQTRPWPVQVTLLVSLLSPSDQLETVTLVGIVLGTIAAIGVATGIVIALAKKMSGRYS